MVSMHSPYNKTETKLLYRVSEEINTFNDAFGDDFMMFRRQKSNGRTGEGKLLLSSCIMIIFLIN